MSPDPAFVPAEIAKEFDTSSETARSAMDRAVREGYLKKKKPGKRTVVYWITEAGEAYFYENADES